MQAVRSDVRKAKALSWLMEHVDVVDPEGQSIDRSGLALSPDPGTGEDDVTPEESPS
jgi:hypothetical protein